jgi:rhamnosyltransferase
MTALQPKAYKALEVLTSIPSCVVLLATYNGHKWLPEQLDSLFHQRGVGTKVIASDDHSSDNTLNLLSEYASKFPLIILPKYEKRAGCANANFLRLIRDADIGDATHIALADQDDIWYDFKLARAVNMLNLNNAKAYSSDVEAFWPDGTVKLIKKSYSQKRFDYLFEAAGPGCTYVFTRALFLELRNWVVENFARLEKLWVHDWTLYAFVRSEGYSWFIDDLPTMKYRQHHSNAIGANSGFKAVYERLSIIKEGKYRYNIIAISELIGASPKCVIALKNLDFFDRLWLISHAMNFRRSFIEVIMIQLVFIFMPSKQANK